MSSLRERLAALDPERRRYTLDTLISHLVNGDQRERVHTLFANRDWLDVRYQDSGNIYDDYITDLEMAWDRTSLPAAFHEVEQGALNTEYAWCFRYALIRCSLNSLSGTLPPEIVIRAVETGLWPTERALSVAARVPKPERRTQLLALLMRSGKLNDLEEAKVRRVVLAAIRTIEQPHDQAAAMKEWAPLLDQSDAAELLELANGISDGSRSLALAALVPLTTQDRRREVIERTLAQASKVLSHDQPRVYEILAPYLAGDLIERAVDRARALEPQYAAVALAKLGRHLANPQRPDLFEESRQKLKQVRDDKDRVYAMRHLVDDFPETDRPALAAWLLKMAHGLPFRDSEWDIPQIVALDIAAPYLDSLDAETALGMLGEVPNEETLLPHLVAVMAKLSKRFAEPRRAEVLGEARARATGNGARKEKEKTRGDEEHETAASIKCLVALAQVLPASEALPLLEQAVAAAFRLPETAGPSNQLRTPRADALVELAQLLPATLLKPILERTGEVRDYLPQCLALARLIPALADPARESVSESAVRASLAIDDESWTQAAIEALAPVLPEAVFELALEAAQSITWDLARGHALAKLAPRVPDRLLERAFKAVQNVPFAPSRSDALLALIPRLPDSLLGEALTAAWNLNWEPGGTKCVAAIAARLPKPQRLQEFHKLIAKYEEDGDDGEEMLAAIAGAADSSTSVELLKLAVESSFDWPSGDAMMALVPLLPEEYLIYVVDSLPTFFNPKDLLRALVSRAGSELLDRAWGQFARVKEPSTQVDAIEVFAPIFKETQVDEALKLASKLKEGIWRCVALEALAPRLNLKQLNRAEKAAVQIDESWIRARALTALIPHLQDPDRQRVARAALDSAKSDRKDIRGRSISLANLIPLLDGKMRTEALKLVMKSAGRTKQWERLAVYGVLVSVLSGSDWGTAASELLAVSDAEEDRIAEALSAMSVPKDPETRHAAQRLLLQHLNRLRDSSRETLLRFISNSSLFSSELLGSRTTERISVHLVEICQRWNWT